MGSGFKEEVYQQCLARRGHINREMAVGTGRPDLCVEFRGARYAIEVKTSANFQGEKSYSQCAKYLDSLGLSEGWMPNWRGTLPVKRLFWGGF